MLTTVGEPGSEATGLTRVTRPSAGATTTRGSSGGTRCGSRKKNAMKAATINKTNPTYHSPSIVVAIPRISGTRMNGMPSRTILKFNMPRFYESSYYVKGDAQLWFHVPFNP